MRLKPFIITILLATSLSWVAFAFVLLNVDPNFADPLGFVFFYLSLFAALSGTISTLLLLLHTKIFSKHVPVYRLVSKSVSESMIVAGLLILTLILQGLHVLTIWNVAVFLMILLLGGSFYATLGRKAH